MVSSISASTAPNPYLSSSFINGVYIPVALIIVGTAIVKTEWVPYAGILAAVLGGWKVYTSRGFLLADLQPASD